MGDYKNPQVLKWQIKVVRATFSICNIMFNSFKTSSFISDGIKNNTSNRDSLVEIKQYSCLRKFTF